MRDDKNLVRLRAKRVLYPEYRPNIYCHAFKAERIDAVERAGGVPILAPDFPRPDRAPIIAVPIQRSKLNDEIQPDYVMPRYVVESLSHQGLYPVFLTFKQWRRQLEYWKPAGIFLGGGNYPVRPEFLANPTNIHPELDFSRFDANIGVLEYAIKHKLPLMGVCAGMQIAGAYFGGKLTSVVNVAPDSTIKHSGRNARHSINIAPASQLAEIVNHTDLMVNSLHRATLSPRHIGDFDVVARSPDGIIEAIELRHPFSSFVGLYQWHPERVAYRAYRTGAPAELFRAFADAINKGF